MKKKTLLAMCCLVAIASSCKKDKPTEPEYVPVENKLLTKVENDQGETYTFTYDGKNRIKTQTLSKGGQDSIKLELTYTEEFPPGPGSPNGIPSYLTSITEKTKGVRTKQYTFLDRVDGFVLNKSKTNGNAVLSTEFQKLTINDGLLNYKSNWNDVDDDDSYTFPYSYLSYDNNKNLLKRTEEVTSTSTATHDLKYDDKKGIWSAANMPSWYFLLDISLFPNNYKNNVTESVRSGNSPNTTKYTYVYDEDNYPKEMTLVNGNTTRISKFTYTPRP